MKYLLEFKKYYDVGDLVIVEYWYNNMITVCRIVGKTRNTYTISHNVEQSSIRNAPDESVKSNDIIDFFKP